MTRGSPATESSTVAPDVATDHLTVAYITGWGRSGTTILDNILGEVPGIFSAGELDYLWTRGLASNFLCGCGEPIRSCPVWMKILARPFQDEAIADVPVTDVISWQRETIRTRSAWRTLRSDAQRIPEPLSRYADLMSALYRAIAHVTGASVIVDSSKRPAGAALLHLLEGIDPFVIHMVRDPRAVAHSWKRYKTQPGFGDGRAMLPHSAWESSIRWIIWNAAASAVREKTPSSVLVRYEDFVTEPRSTVASLADVAKHRGARSAKSPDEGDLPFEDEHTVKLGVNHTVSGNPSRFKHGSVRIAPDDEWHERQKMTDRVISTLITLPWLRRYDYPISTKRHRQSRS